METRLHHRSTIDVLHDHLACRANGDLDADLERNYASDVLLISYEGVSYGHEGVRKLAGILKNYANPDDYSYDQVIAEREVGYLRWSAEGEDLEVHDGTDSFVVRDGKIVAQTIWYAIKNA
jgi:hypothetical protein